MTKSVIKFVAIALTAAAMFVLAALLPVSVVNSRPSPHLPLTPQVVMAQAVEESDRADQFWRRVYELMPDLPREDQYVNIATGEAAPNSTLASRMVQYHLFVKSRAPNYRLDWKLTIADYLDANEWISPSAYPGADTLRPNPVEGDEAAIGHLNRADRDRLVAALVNAFSSGTAGNNANGDNANGNSVTPSQSPAPANPASPSSAPIQTEPGAAQLLLP